MIYRKEGKLRWMKQCALPKLIVSIFYNYNILEIAYIETSALNASNVDKAFKNLVTEIYKISKAHQ